MKLVATYSLGNLQVCVGWGGGGGGIPNSKLQTLHKQCYYLLYNHFQWFSVFINSYSVNVAWYSYQFRICLLSLPRPSFVFSPVKEPFFKKIKIKYQDLTI